MNENEHIVLWSRCLKIIYDNVGKTNFETWFKPIKPLSYVDNTMTIGVPSQFFYEYLDEKYADLLRATLYKEIGVGTKLMYRVLIIKDTDETVTIPGNNGKITTPRPTTDGNKAPNPINELDSQLIPGYNFENFIKGTSNEFSRNIAETIAEDPTKPTFNPLFLYGPSGVGKTHLTNAIGTRIKELYPEKRVLYISAHLLQRQYTDSVRTNNFNNFMNFYQTIDVLIVDDIQEFAGLTKTQNTFFHIFNHLQQNKKQLILTSDRSPAMLQHMEERLLTRFKWGLIAELEKPDVELRKNILRSKIQRDGLTIPENVIEFIAENVNESVRELEGIIRSLLARSIYLKKEINLDLAEHVIRKSVRYEKKSITIESIIEKVCEYYKIDKTAIHLKTRKRAIVQARQVAMYLAKLHTDNSLGKIGKSIGNRDHATVLHACKIVKEQVEVDKAFKAELSEIETSIRH